MKTKLRLEEVEEQIEVWEEEEEERQEIAQSKEDERPVLNITQHVKKKKNQRTSSVANRTNPHRPGSSSLKYD